MIHLCWASRGHTFHTISAKGCDDHCSTWGIFNSSNSFNSAIWIQVDEKNNPPLKGLNHMTYHSPGLDISPGLRKMTEGRRSHRGVRRNKTCFFRVSVDCEFMYTWRVRSYIGKEDVCLHSVLKLSLYMIGWCWLVNCSVLIPFQTIGALRMTFLNWSARVLHVALPWGTCLESGHSSRISCIPHPLARSDTDTKNEETADVGSLRTFEQGAFVTIGSDPIVKLYIHIYIYPNRFYAQSCTEGHTT